MTPAERNRWKRRLDRANRILTKGMAADLMAEFRRCVRDVASGTWNADRHRLRTEAILRAWYGSTANAARLIAWEMLGPKKRNDPPPTGPAAPPPETPWEVLVERFVRQFAPQRARSIASATDAALLEALTKAAREGLGEVGAQKAVAEALGGNVTRARARMIARTEIGAAQNAALLMSAEERGDPVRRQWLAIEDDRTRSTHATADGQTIGPGEKFKVGLAMLDHPGDPTGPLREIINCRCTMLLLPTD